MNSVWATARALADFLDGIARQVSAHELTTRQGDTLRTSGRLVGAVDETGARSHELVVEVRVAERNLQSPAPTHDCTITVRAVGICSMVVVASADDIHTAVAEASARAVRAVESRLAVALWPVSQSPA